MGAEKQLASRIAYRLMEYENFSISIEHLAKKKHEPERKIKVQIAVRKTAEYDTFNHTQTFFDLENVDKAQVILDTIDNLDNLLAENLSAKEKFYEKRRAEREERDLEKRKEKAHLKRVRKLPKD